MTALPEDQRELQETVPQVHGRWHWICEFVGRAGRSLETRIDVDLS